MVAALDMAPEVLSSILACCDIASVVSAGQTCKYLHDIAFHKSLWVVLLENLRRRSILDETSTPDLKELSTDELIQLVKRLLNGPATWNYQNADSGPEVSRQITLHPSLTGRRPAYKNCVELLPSGRYVLFTNQETLHCWSVADDRLIWKYTSADPYARVLDFAAEESKGGNSLILMICLHTNPSGVGRERKNFVEIVTVDLRNETQNVLLTALSPDSGNRFQGPVIRGALAAVLIVARRSYMVINWRTQSYFLFDCHGRSFISSSPVVALISHHLVLKALSVDEEDQIHVISHDALHPYWAPHHRHYRPRRFLLSFGARRPKAQHTHEYGGLGIFPTHVRHRKPDERR
ncbi:hypothetical protein B0H19DRAFT_1255155 [Mycena capillaripes]|nr:hypothetical protein B0H19DRAFT_1255155 [Mycena capillaripes]